MLLLANHTASEAAQTYGAVDGTVGIRAQRRKSKSSDCCPAKPGAGHNRKSFFRWLKSVKGNPKTDLSRYITIADGKHYVQGRANAHYIAMVPVFASTTTCLRHIAGVLLSERPPLGWV